MTSACGRAGVGAAATGSVGTTTTASLLIYTLSINTFAPAPTSISCAMCCLVVRFSNSDIGICSLFHVPWVRPLNVTSCSTSSPPPNAASPPKSTSLTLNKVKSGDHTSKLKNVMPVTSNWDATVSMPTNTNGSYFFVSFPAICKSVSVASDQLVCHVSTGTLMYVLLNNEMTSAGAITGA